MQCRSARAPGARLARFASQTGAGRPFWKASGVCGPGAREAGGRPPHHEPVLVLREPPEGAAQRGHHLRPRGEKTEAVQIYNLESNYKFDSWVRTLTVAAIVCGRGAQPEGARRWGSAAVGERGGEGARRGRRSPGRPACPVEAAGPGWSLMVPETATRGRIGWFGDSDQARTWPPVHKAAMHVWILEGLRPKGVSRFQALESLARHPPCRGLQFSSSCETLWNFDALSQTSISSTYSRPPQLWPSSPGSSGMASLRTWRSMSSSTDVRTKPLKSLRDLAESRSQTCRRGGGGRGDAG